MPGSGKTTAIVALATRLIAERHAEGGQVLIVTYQNAAVDNVRARIGQRLQEMDMLPVGYDVRTLHSLAYGIVQANPGLVGAVAEFTVLDERASESLLDKAVRTWNDDNKGVWGRLGPGEYVGSAVGAGVARHCAEQSPARSSPRPRTAGCEPRTSWRGSADGRTTTSFCGSAQKSTSSTSSKSRPSAALDFDDLVWMAVEMLQQYPDLCSRYRRRWPFVLEDEAQDSVPLQEELIALLMGPGGNWIRVGDPNQAIMSTFTAADPRYLRDFLEREDVAVAEMTISGRCAPKIMDLANFLVEWAAVEHPPG